MDNSLVVFLLSVLVLLAALCVHKVEQNRVQIKDELLQQGKEELESTNKALTHVKVELESTRQEVKQVKVELDTTKEQINILRKEMIEKDNARTKEINQIRADVEDPNKIKTDYIFYCREMDKRVLELERKVEKCASEKSVEKLKEEVEDIQSHELCGADNLALQKTCGQSSEHVNGIFSCEKALDGNKDNFMHTKDGFNKNGDYYGEAYPYWWVDLGTNCIVRRIKIYNRTTCCGERLHDLEITIGKQLSNMKYCARFKGPAVEGQVLDMNCKIPTAARYVKLMIMDNSLNNLLHVAEVEVFAN
ncbi:fucolectin-7-like isoform X2 [Mytilus edulis]|uniref:fucolectin-7-like isoform X2 n=1 Tax=Mytilus edulis TaxID=6550 RepID=UPI0039EE0DDB